MNSLSSLSAQEALSLSLGQLGSDRVADTLTHHADTDLADAGADIYYPNVKTWVAIKCISDTIFAAGCEVDTDYNYGTPSLGVNKDPSAPTDTDPMSAGDIRFGRFKTIVLTSGIIELVRGV